MSPASRHYDAIVIGIGAMGSATVYQLAQRGKRVLGLERTGIPAPRIWLPGWVANAMAGVMSAFEKAMHRDFVFSAEGLRALTDYTFYASADRAKRELGWAPRAVEAAFRDVLEYERGRRR